jgi:multimeric flavodoxin WrbA
MVIDTAVSKVLEGARSIGADTEKIYLTDTAIEFCTNCRKCTIDPTDGIRGKCVIDDQMAEVLDKIDAADGIVMASPVNFGSVTAITERFIERLSVYAKWKLDGKVRPPTKRIKHKTKRAVVITSSTMPMIMGRILAPRVLGVMKDSVDLMGAKVVGTLWFGMLPAAVDIKLSEKQQNKAFDIGRKLAQ